MSDNSPFKIRLELLSLAQSILELQVNAKHEQLRNEWDASEVKNAYPELPTVSTQDIIDTAEKLNAFVSNK